MVDAAAARLAPRQHHVVPLEQLDPALLPGVLVLADDYGLGVAPHKKHWVHDRQVLLHVLLGRQVKQDVVRLRVKDVYVRALGGAQEGGQML